MKITLKQSQNVAQNAFNVARELKLSIAVTVVDDSGRLVLTLRDDGAGFFTAETSKAKALAAVAFKKPTNELIALREQNPFWQEVATVLGGQVLPTAGGCPIIVEGTVIGGVGIGGGTPDQDQRIANEAAKS